MHIIRTCCRTGSGDAKREGIVSFCSGWKRWDRFTHFGSKAF